MATKDSTSQPTGSATRSALPRMDRTDPPGYLQRYLEREARGAQAPTAEMLDLDRTESTPLYLRRFRDRKSGANPLEEHVPMWEGHDLGVTNAYSRITKTKEIVPESPEQAGRYSLLKSTLFDMVKPRAIPLKAD